MVTLGYIEFMIKTWKTTVTHDLRTFSRITHTCYNAQIFHLCCKENAFIFNGRRLFGKCSTLKLASSKQEGTYNYDVQLSYPILEYDSYSPGIEPINFNTHFCVNIFYLILHPKFWTDLFLMRLEFDLCFLYQPWRNVGI